MSKFPQEGIEVQLSHKLHHGLPIDQYLMSGKKEKSLMSKLHKLSDSISVIQNLNS